MGDRTEGGQQAAAAEEAAERDDFARQTGYQPSANQAREEPVPASRHEDRRQEAVLRNEQLGQEGTTPGPAGEDEDGPSGGDDG